MGSVLGSVGGGAMLTMNLPPSSVFMIAGLTMLMLGLQRSRQQAIQPTTAALEAKITALGNGVVTACFATGIGAILAVFLTRLRAGSPRAQPTGR